jgi:hypothetical protein
MPFGAGEVYRGVLTQTGNAKRNRCYAFSGGLFESKKEKGRQCVSQSFSQVC